MAWQKFRPPEIFSAMRPRGNKRAARTSDNAGSAPLPDPFRRLLIRRIMASGRLAAKVPSRSRLRFNVEL